MSLEQTLTEGAIQRGISLTDRQITQFSRYASLLIRWNEKMNLTTITDPDEIAVKHFLDSLTGIAFLPENGRVIDVGTGAGFPGIPLKIVRPDIELTLLDALEKRIGFLEEVVRELSLDKVTCVHARAEEAAHLPAYRE